MGPVRNRPIGAGCSAGGRQAPQRGSSAIPEDFDGVVSGSPGINWTGRAAQAIWIAQAIRKDEASTIPPAKFRIIHNAALEACAAADGVKDGVIEDPTRCKFDPQALECKGPDGPACLTGPQVEAARKIYAPVTNPRTKEEIFPGHEPGSELGWSTMAGAKPMGTGLDLFKFVVFKDPNWDYRTLNFDTDMALVVKADSGVMNALDPNLKRLLRARRKNSPVSRVVRPANLATQQRPLLQECARYVGWRRQGHRFLPLVHDTRYGALWRR